jgi:hypothetical protein
MICPTKKGNIATKNSLFISIFLILAKFHTKKSPCGYRLVTHLRLDIKKTEVTPKLGLIKRRQQHKGHPGKFATKFQQLGFLAATMELTMGSHNLLKRLSFPYRLV